MVAAVWIELSGNGLALAKEWAAAPVGAVGSPAHAALLAAALAPVVGMLVLFTLLIVILVVQGLNGLSAARLRLARETGFLHQAQERLRSLQPAAVLAQPHPAEWLLRHAGLTGDGEQSVVAHRVRRMDRLSRTRLAGEQILADLLHRNEDLKPQDARFSVSILVFVALLGTVATMTVAMMSLPSFSSQTAAAADFGALDAMISHMRLAFLITAAGILGTVVLAWANHGFNRQQEAFLLGIEEFSLDVLAPMFLGHPEQVAVKHLEALFSGAAQSAAYFETAAGTFASAVSQLSEVTNSATSHLPEAIQAGTQLVTYCARTADSLGSAAAHFEGTVAGMSSAVGSLPQQIETLGECTERIARLLAELRQGQDQARVDLLGTLQAWNGVAERLEALKGTMQATYAQVELSLRETRDEMRSDREAFGGVLRAQSERAREQLEALGAALPRVAAELTAAAQQSGATSQQAMQGVCSQLEAALRRLAPLLEHVEGSSRELRATLEQIRRVSDGQQLVELSKGLNHLPDRISQSLADTSVSTELRLAASALQQAAAANGASASGNSASGTADRQLAQAIGDLQAEVRMLRRVLTRTPLERIWPWSKKSGL